MKKTTILNRHQENGDVRKFLWLSRAQHVQLIEAELQEDFDATGIHTPFEAKLRQIVDDYCRAKKKKRRPAPNLKPRKNVA